MKLRMQAMIVAVLAVVLADVTPAASQTTDNGRRSWNAQWITCPDLPGRAPAVVHFRKVLDLPSKPDHLVVHVSADNAYRLHVNQEYVGSGPSRGDLAHWKYETYDLAPFLRAGTNVIAATVWNFGEHAAAAQISDRLGFVLQSEDRTEPSLTTDENWEVEHEKGVAAVPTPFNVLPNSYYAAEPIERIDGSTFDWSWDFSTPGPRSRWTKARSEG